MVNKKQLFEKFTSAALTMIKEHPELTRLGLLAKLQSRHNITASENAMQKFWKMLEQRKEHELPLLSLKELNTLYQQAAAVFREKNPSMSSTDLRQFLAMEHNVSADEKTMAGFHVALLDRSRLADMSLLDVLENQFLELD